VARTVSEHLLARSEKGAERFFSLSSQLRKERKAYIENLEKYCSGNLEITPWLLWWLTCITYALKSTESVLSRILYKAEFRKVYSATPLNERQRKMIDLLLGEFQGRLTSTKWAEITGSSPDSALRDIQDLISKKILKREDGGGRSTCYDLNFRGME
jgi:Fic family protein